MRMREWMKAAVVTAGLCLLALPALAQSSSQQTGDPVADAARKAREQKKNAAKPKKVFTEDDVKSAAPEPATNAAGTAATTAPGQKPGDAGQADDPNGEKAWRKKFAEQHAKIDKAQQELDILQRELEKSQLQYYNDPQKALTEQNNRADINDKTAKIEAKKKEIDQLRQELDDLETQLRKAGGDPGWAR
ncbi:MAG TPA: hypothetical protein VE263_17975 [Candidatus Angelobacter sp.]|nr:hypothetical protein [Candidatus Angelobacter sp.]